MVVITQGVDPTIVFVSGDDTAYPIVVICTEMLVDTNGAGNASVGGYTSCLVQEKSVAFCCAPSAYAASFIVQQSGCTFPPQPDFTYSA